METGYAVWLHAGSSVLTFLGVVLGFIHMQHGQKKLGAQMVEIHLMVNSRLDMLLHLTATTGRLEGAEEARIKAIIDKVAAESKP